MNQDRFYLNELEKYPQLSLLLSQADSLVAKKRADLITVECKPAFDALLKSADLTEIVQCAIQNIADGDHSEPDWIFHTSDDWLIANTEQYALRLTVARPNVDSTEFRSLQYNCLIGNLNGSSFHVNINRFPHKSEVDFFKPGLAAVTGIENIEVPKGSSILFDAATDIPEFVFQSTVLTVCLHTHSYAPIIWYFDRASRLSKMAAAAYDDPTRLQTCANILQNLLRAENLPTEASLLSLAKLTSSQHHFVRWSAIQSMCAIDLNYGRQHLINACEDHHPLVSQSAKRAVAKYLIT